MARPTKTPAKLSELDFWQALHRNKDYRRDWEFRFGFCVDGSAIPDTVTNTGHRACVNLLPYRENDRFFPIKDGRLILVEIDLWAQRSSIENDVWDLVRYSREITKQPSNASKKSGCVSRHTVAQSMHFSALKVLGDEIVIGNELLDRKDRNRFDRIAKAMAPLGDDHLVPPDTIPKLIEQLKTGNTSKKYEDKWDVYDAVKGGNKLHQLAREISSGPSDLPSEDRRLRRSYKKACSMIRQVYRYK